MNTIATLDLQNFIAKPDCLKDRVILVTGAGSGIGAIAAKTYAAHGATVVLLGKTISKLEKVYDEIKAAGHPEAALYPLNLMGAAEKDYTDLAATIERELGQLNGVLHNAAYIGEMTPIRYYDLELWQRTVHVNLTAPFMLTKACITLLQKSTSPRIIFTSHQVASAYWGAYAVAKAGIESFMRILADELDGDKFISVNAIAPGEVQAPTMGKVYPGKNLTELPTIESIMPVYLYLMQNSDHSQNGSVYNAGNLSDLANLR